VPELKTTAPFYGPPLDQVGGIKAVVLDVYAADPSDFAKEGNDEPETALTEAGRVPPSKSGTWKSTCRIGCSLAVTAPFSTTLPHR
jgi:hypothetical protein